MSSSTCKHNEHNVGVMDRVTDRVSLSSHLQTTYKLLGNLKISCRYRVMNRRIHFPLSWNYKRLMFFTFLRTNTYTSCQDLSRYVFFYILTYLLTTLYFISKECETRVTSSQIQDLWGTRLWWFFTTLVLNKCKSNSMWLQERYNLIV